MSSPSIKASKVPSEAPTPYSERPRSYPPYNEYQHPVEKKQKVPLDSIRGGVQQEDIQDYAQILQGCEEGDGHTAQTLLDSGASPNAPQRLCVGYDRHSYTPTEGATRNNHIEIVRQLILAGANVITDFDSFTRLVTTGEPDQDTVKLLVNSGHNLRVQYNYPKINYGHKLRMKDSGRKINLSTFAICEAHPFKAIEGLIQVDQWLLMDQRSSCTVHDAVNVPLDRRSSRYYDVLRSLMRHRFHIEYLFQAIDLGDTEFVRIILDVFGAVVNLRSWGSTPLEAAFQRSRMDPCVDIIKEVLKADPSFKGIYNGGEVDFEAVRLLFDILLAWSGGLKKPGRARSLANTWKDRTGLKSDPYLFLCLAAVLGNADVVQEVLPLCEKPDPKKRYTKTQAFIKAVEYQHSEVIQLLSPYSY